MVGHTGCFAAISGDGTVGCPRHLAGEAYDGKLDWATDWYRPAVAMLAMADPDGQLLLMVQRPRSRVQLVLPLFWQALGKLFIDQITASRRKSWLSRRQLVLTAEATFVAQVVDFASSLQAENTAAENTARFGEGVVVYKC